MADAIPAETGVSTSADGSGEGAWWSRLRAAKRAGTGVAWRTLGQALEGAGREQAAVYAYRRAMARDPVDFPSRHRAGALLRHHGNVAQAEAIYRELLTINPHDAGAAGQLGHILVDKGHSRDYHEAEGLLRRAIDLGADVDKALVPLCRLLAAQEREGDILDLTEHETGVHALGQRGQAEAALGRMAAARTSFQAVLAQDPDHARAWYSLAGLRLMDGAREAAGLDADTSLPEHLADKARAADGLERAWWAFAAGYTLEDAERYDEAWAFYDDANACVRQHLVSNAAEIEDHERRIRATYTAPVLNRLAGGQVTTPGPTPVFIVGMPRSGTTLMERIIGAHPQAAPLGERADLQEIMGAMTPSDMSARYPWPERAAYLRPVAAGAIAGAYLARVNSLAFQGAQVAVDKMPEQFRQLGVIAATMPQARIIHVTRDARDVAVSNYTARFHDGLAWSFDLESIARRQTSYEATLEHWRALLPRECFLEVSYEALVRDPEKEVARLLAFLGLHYEDACVHGHSETSAPVRTSSMAQVRRGISTGSIGRWQRFGAARLAPVINRM
mgnify:CR=1 FL=1